MKDTEGKPSTAWYIDWNSLVKEVPADEPGLFAIWFGHSLCREFLRNALEDEDYDACATWQRAIAADAPRLINADMPVNNQDEGVPLSDAMSTKENFLAALRGVLSFYQHIEWGGADFPGINSLEATMDDPTRNHPDRYLSFSFRHGQGGQIECYFEGQLAI